MTERDEIEAEVGRRAATDGEFRARLLAEPHDTLAELTGSALPDKLSIRIEEEQPGEIILVLPPAATDDALPDSDLVGSAGGGWNNYSEYCNF